MELSIGILSYNTKELLRDCLDSIIKYSKHITYEIIVVDNASTDGSLQMLKGDYPKIKVIANKKNKYYSKGYNQIIKVAKGKYLIMLNSDTYLKNNSFRKMLDFMDKNNLFACEGLEIKPDGMIISTGSLFRSLLSDFFELSLLGKFFRDEKYLRKIRMKNKNRRKNFEIDVGCNAFFCITTQLIKEINGYDENFLLYYTEDDICKKIKDKGYKIFHFGSSYVIHYDAVSTMKLGWKRVELFHKDLLTYHTKYNNKFFAYVLYVLLFIERIFLMTYKIIESRAFNLIIF